MNKVPVRFFIDKYNEISKKCKITGEPIYITKNDNIELVVMSIEVFERQQAILTLKEKLLDIELEQINGAKYYSLEELDIALKELIEL